MAEYIEREAVDEDEGEKYWCENCCNFDKENVGMDATAICKLTGCLTYCQEYGGNCKGFNAPAADVVEVRHGRWHIMPEDPYDESECPTEEGWYRIITTDGEEMTDYYFAKPTLIGYGVVFWKNCKKVIRAWAKMDGKGEGE